MQKREQNMLQTELQLIYQYSQEIFLLFDRNGKIIDYNQAAKKELGYDDSFNEVSIASIFRRVIKKDNNKLIINSRYLNYTTETVAYRKNKTCFPVDLRVAFWPGTSKTYGLCIATNISGRKDKLREIRKLKNELKSMDKFKNDFIANITHELKTPVNGIIGLTNALIETSLKPKQLDLLNMLYSICLKMETIINNIIDYSKLANNNMVLEQREFDFPNFIKSIISMHYNSIEEKGLKLIVNVGEDIPQYVVGDEFRLAQVLNNIISNAIKFTSTGQIAIQIVKVAETSTTVELFFMIIDTGIGISPEERDQLFKSFTQVDGSSTRRYGGTGLGLTISKLIIEAMNGTIAVESEKNQGSTFSFNIKLGIPNEKENIVVKEDLEPYDNEIVYLEEDTTVFPEADYISRIFHKSKNNSIDTEEIHLYNELEGKPDRKNVADILFDRLEKLIICIEMESWKKAEDNASYIKEMISTENIELRNICLSLVLAVRKEKKEQSIRILDKLKNKLDEVI